MNKAIIWTALAVNFLAVVGCCILVRMASTSHASDSATGVWVALGFMLYPILNLAAISARREGESWLGLYLRRKKAEELARIRDLEARR